MIENTSGYEPVAHAVLTLPDAPEETKGRIQMPTQVEERMLLAQVQATIVAIGSDAWADESKPRASVGDRILLARFSGTMLDGKDGKKYRAINDRDVFMKVVDHG